MTNDTDLIWEYAETQNVSETVEVYGFKSGAYSQLNETMKTFKYQKSRSLSGLFLKSLVFQHFQAFSPSQRNISVFQMVVAT